MQRKITLVLGLVLTFLIIIDLLQVLWLYNNYNEERKQYSQTLSSAIGEASFKYQLLNLKKNGNEAATFYIISSNDTINHEYLNEAGKDKISFEARQISIDSIEGGLGRSQLVQMQTRKIFDLKTFDSLFKASLSKKGIDVPYILDTFSNPAQTRKRVPQKKGGDVVASKAKYPTKHKDYPVTSSSMLVNTYGNVFVYASFKPYPQFLFKKMFWPLISSLLIFLLTNFALVYVIKTIRQQKKLNEIKNDFINNMTHELRTPITIATSAIDAILNHHGLEDKEKARSYLQTSKGELLHLDHLVEKILNIAIEDKNDLELHYEKVDIRSLLSTIIDNHTLTAGKKLEFNINADVNIEVVADKMHLANALNNIIDNAIKYSKNSVRVDIACSINDEKAIIIIKDNGIGIEKEYLTQIFHPFFRVPHGNLHDVKGFGLGLSYVKKVIEKHGGTIEVESNPQQGSIFTLSLPINQAI
ncbi:MAG TPA: HAMP domain-containing sensor histidine kinase [Segetibacter sp.]|jgi:signal transduction histidine kinase